MPVKLDQLPPLDAVIVSHDHYDHLDYPTRLELARTDVPFFTSLGVGSHLESWGIAEQRITELDWWESAPIAGGRATVSAAPSQHFSGRAPGMRNTTAWSSFALRGERHGFFFSGDTGLTSEYSAISERLGPFDLVALEVGAFHPAWGDIHLGPENALKAFELLGGGRFLPVHWGTFNLAMHDWDEPAEVLLEAPAKPRTAVDAAYLGTRRWSRAARGRLQLRGGGRQAKLLEGTVREAEPVRAELDAEPTDSLAARLTDDGGKAVFGVRARRGGRRPPTTPFSGVAPLEHIPTRAAYSPADIAASLSFNRRKKGRRRGQYDLRCT